MTYVSAELRRKIIELSGDCCEYCRVPQRVDTFTFHVEHIIAESHGGQTTEGNLAYSCPYCNRYKGTNIAAADPETGDPTFLFPPRRHNWTDHFQLNGAVLDALTPEGRATIFVLHLNDPERIEYRQSLLDFGEYPC